MDKRDRERKEHEKGRREEREDERHENHGEHHEPHGTGYGREQTVYREYMTRRWQGSQPPSPQAYSLAAKQFRQLPGSVVTTAFDLGTLPPVPPSTGRHHPPHHPEKREKR
jgi:hypothetical protein